MEFYLKQKIEFNRLVRVECDSEEELKELVNTTHLDWDINVEDFIIGNIEVFDEDDEEDNKLFELNIEDLENIIPIDSEYTFYNTISQVKGIEFDSVIVFDNDMTENEKYIAYTRALNELYIVNESI